MKILVFTVASWNSKIGSNTWATLLDGYDPSLLANIYIRDETPDSHVCSRYFGISENRVIKSIFNRKIQTGKEVAPQIPASSDGADLSEHNARYQRMKVKRRYSMLLARELVWKLGRWKTPELDAFLDDFKPAVILHSMDGYIHLNRIIEYAIKRTGAAAVGYIWDDNFTYKQQGNLGYKLYRFFQRKSLKKLASMTEDFFAISPFTKKEADEFFNIDSHVLTKPLLKVPAAQVYSRNFPLRILYTGNLFIGRDISLLRLSEALKQVNGENVLFALDVYTNTFLSDEMLSKLQSEYCRIHKPIPQSDALQKQKEADILLFLEDIDGKNANVARLSFSTKITDYLSTGKCILAIGNKNTAPMQYFIQNNAAVVCGCDEDIMLNLKQISASPDRMNECAQNAVQAAIRNHNPESIRKLFFSVINNAYKAKKAEKE